MEHALIEDDEPVRFHINQVEHLSIFIPIVDVEIIFHGKFSVEEDLVDEFRAAVLRSDGVTENSYRCASVSNLAFIPIGMRERSLGRCRYGTIPPLPMTSGFTSILA